VEGATVGKLQEEQMYWVPVCWWKLEREAKLGSIYLTYSETRKECNKCYKRHEKCLGKRNPVKIKINPDI